MGKKFKGGTGAQSFPQERTDSLRFSWDQCGDWGISRAGFKWRECGKVGWTKPTDFALSCGLLLALLRAEFSVDPNLNHTPLPSAPFISTSYRGWKLQEHSLRLIYTLTLKKSLLRGHSCSPASGWESTRTVLRSLVRFSWIFFLFIIFFFLFLISELDIYSASTSIHFRLVKRAVCLPTECEL